MKNIDIEKIKRLTNSKIGYSNFKYELEIRNDKRKKLTLAFVICCTVLLGTITVNAITDNGIVNLINRIIKVNGIDREAQIYEDLNAISYDYNEDGTLTTSHSKCIKYSPDKNINETPIEICFEKDTEFKEIEIFYDDDGIFRGFHITGKDNGEYFEQYLPYIDYRVKE